jgi:hypothetical protein
MVNQFMYVLAVLVLAGVVTRAHFDGSSQNNLHQTWCDEIYHRNVSCPKYGKVSVPAEVLAKEAASTLEWCDETYHRNTICPKHGSVTVPTEVLEQEMIRHKEWCERIGHRNVSCDEHKVCSDEI